MKRFLLLFIVFCSLLVSSISSACDNTISSASTSGDDEIFYENSSDDNKKACVTSTGSLIVSDHDNNGLVRFKNADNVELVNEGTLQIGLYEGVGTFSSENNTVVAKDGSSIGVTVTNSGIIAASGNLAVNLKAADGNITVTNNAGAIITSSSSSGAATLNLSSVGSAQAGNVIVTNAGTIITQGPTHGDDFDLTSGNADGNTWSSSRVSAGDYTGYNDTSHHALRLEDVRFGSTVTVDNSGTIESQACCAVNLLDSTDEINFTNSGTIKSIIHGAFQARGTQKLTLTNSGTITGSGTLHKDGTGANVKASLDLSNQGADYTGSGATIINSGTIEASGNDYHAISIGTASSGSDGYNNVTITNSGTIAGDQTSADGVDGHAIRVYEDSSGTTINIKEEATFTGGVDLGKTESTIVLDSSITKDITMQIYNYDSDLTITNNLTGNDTYSITEEDLDSDGTADDGTLTILGEDLEIGQDNPKYRSENVLTKMRGLFDAANYINWHFPEDKFFKIFHSTQKREGTYKGDMSGVVGQLSPMLWGAFRSNFFVGYTRQDGDFDNGEFLGGDNFALGLKSVYEKNGFKASFTPMVGLNDLTITDFDTDTLTKINTNLLAEFAGFNTKLGKEIKTSEEGSLNLSVQTTLGVQRFPQYLAKFSDGDLSVDEAIEQVLGAGFEVRYKEDLGKSFIIQPYAGVNLNNNLNNNIKITADGENKNVSPAASTTTGYYAGVSFTKKAKDINLDLDLMYGNEDGLINQIAAFSLTKSFGKAEIKTAKLETVPDFPKVDESLTTQDFKKDLEELKELRNLNKELKAQNEKLKAENEKLKLLSAKTLKENEASKQLIVELLKENEKVKLTNEIFKKKILENENREILKSMEAEVAKPQFNKFGLLLFFATLIWVALAITSFIISILKRISLRLVN